MKRHTFSMIASLVIWCAACGSLPSGSSTTTGNKEAEEASDTTTSNGSNSPVALPPVASDPSFILTARFDTKVDKTGTITGTVTRSNGTPVSGETVTAVLTRAKGAAKSLKSASVIPDTLESVDGNTATTGADGGFAMSFDGVEFGDKIFAVASQSNALKLDTLFPSIESLVDLNSNELSLTTATEVRADSFFLLRFSESMLKSSINNETVTIACDSGAIPVTVTTSVDTVGIGFIEYRITPTYQMPPLSTCTLTIAAGTSGVLDLSDNPMAAQASYQITTGPTKIAPFTQWLEVTEDLPTFPTDSATAVIGSTTYTGSIGTDANGKAVLKVTSMQPQPESLGGTVEHIALAQGGSMLYIAWSETDSTGTEVIYLQHYDGAAWVQDGSAISNASFTATEPTIVFSGTTPYVSYLAGTTKVDQGQTLFLT